MSAPQTAAGLDARWLLRAAEVFDRRYSERGKRRQGRSAPTPAGHHTSPASVGHGRPVTAPPRVADQPD